MNKTHVLQCESLDGWRKNTIGPVPVSHEVLAPVIGGVIRYASPYPWDFAADVIQPNAAVTAATLRFKHLPWRSIEHYDPVQQRATAGTFPGLVLRL